MWAQKNLEGQTPCHWDTSSLYWTKIKRPKSTFNFGYLHVSIISMMLAGLFFCIDHIIYIHNWLKLGYLVGVAGGHRLWNPVWVLGAYVPCWEWLHLCLTTSLVSTVPTSGPVPTVKCFFSNGVGTSSSFNSFNISFKP